MPAMDCFKTKKAFLLCISVIILFEETRANNFWNSRKWPFKPNSEQHHEWGHEEYSKERSHVYSDYHPRDEKPFYLKDMNSHTNLYESKNCESKRPHIIFIVADDLGWNDVSWNNEEFRTVTPTLGQLAEEGVILDSFYAQPHCTPSRASFTLGLYPFKTGFQHRVLATATEGGIAPSFSTLPERLRNLGYSTHLIGKWHLGFCKDSFTPTKVGFDSFYGSYSGGFRDYFTKMTSAPGNPGLPSAILPRLLGFDFRDNTGVIQDNTTYIEFLLRKRAIEIIQNLPKGQSLFLEYSTNMPHVPLQVPAEYENRFPFIDDYNRRIYASMMSILDDSVRDIVDALKRRGIWEDTLLVFMSDNGGDTLFGGASNDPLRGRKGGFYEGGVRVPAFVHGNLIERKGRRSQGLVHAVDWLNTFLHVSGGIVDGTLDSLNAWDMISKGDPSPRTEIIHNIDLIAQLRSIRSGDYKLIATGPFEDTIGSTTELYNIQVDPLETNNLVGQETQVALRLLQKLSEQEQFLVPSFNDFPGMFEKADPDNFGGVFSPGWC